MEISEIQKMFNMNKIPADESQLIELFFKGKSIPKGEEPSLDFFNLMKFALSKENDQDFRNFMRKIKIKNIIHEKEEAEEKEKLAKLLEEDKKREERKKQLEEERKKRYLD